MDAWFNEIATRRELSAEAEHELLTFGFIVIPGLVKVPRLEQLSQAYDAAVAEASPADVRVGSTTTRVHDFVNRGAHFDELYVYRPVLEACSRLIGGPFKLSSLLARTLRPASEAQPLHVDFKADGKGWPMLGFIVMVDDFTTNNGATRFVPGSHKWLTVPDEVMKNPRADHEQQVLTCGPAGSVIIYNGSVWHGHTANQTNAPRRSIQGSYIRRDAESAIGQTVRIRHDTLGRISALAKYVLAF
jgi:hypothetical protein